MNRSRPLAVLVLATAVVTLALAPAPAHAQAQRGGYAGPGTLVGGFLGFDQGDLDGGAFRFDAELGLQRLAPAVMLAGVGSIGYSHLSFDHQDFTQRFDLFEVVPAARFVVPLGPQLGVYGDLGLGLYWGNLHTHDYFLGYHADDTLVGLAARIGAGGYVWVNNQVRLGLELALHPHFGDYEDTSFTAMAGVMFRTR